LRILRQPPRYVAVAADTDGVRRDLAGHIRHGLDGAIEFAPGYNDLLLPRGLVASAALRTLAPSRGWIHALATGKRRAQCLSDENGRVLAAVRASEHRRSKVRRSPFSVSSGIAVLFSWPRRHFQGCFMETDVEP
jgi:hypothetical protein